MLLISVNLPAKTLRLNTENTVCITGQIMPFSLLNTMMRITTSFNAPSDKPLYILINTNGGDVNEGMTFINIVKKSVHRPVHTISRVAYSMGFIIAESFDKRYIIPEGVMLTHKVRSQAFIYDEKSVREASSAMESIQKIYDDMAAHMKMTKEEYNAFMDKEIFVVGNNAVKLNMVDEVVDYELSLDLLKTGECI